jgi:hypothetical protein
VGNHEASTKTDRHGPGYTKGARWPEVAPGDVAKPGAIRDWEKQASCGSAGISTDNRRRLRSDYASGELREWGSGANPWENSTYWSGAVPYQVSFTKENTTRGNSSRSIVRIQ